MDSFSLGAVVERSCLTELLEGNSIFLTSISEGD